MPATRPITTAALSAAAALLTALLPAPAAALPPLDAFAIAPGSVTVSGLSSGGYMANQFHVAYSGLVRGAGILAAGPYHCAKGNVATALTDCTTPGPFNAPNPAYSIGVTDGYAARGEIDPPANLRDARVWLFSGMLDATVYPVVVDRLADYYRHYVDPANVVVVRSVPAAHAFVTDGYGQPCGHAGNGDDPADAFINDCGYDAAGVLLQHLYGPLQAPSGSPTGRIVAFDQSAFIAQPTAHSLNPTGYAYVPRACDGGAPCRLHVAFHGCRQQTSRIGDRFYRHTGYNDWADRNRIVVLYPQATNSDLPPVYNPRGCWDWWGYDDADYAKRSGRQMAAVKSMVDRLSAGHDPRPPAPPATLAVVQADATTATLSWPESRGPRADRYNVYVASAAEGPWTRAGSTAQTTTVVTGLQPATTVHFRVRTESRLQVEGADSPGAVATTQGPSRRTPRRAPR